MAARQKSKVSLHRARLADRGLVRVEVTVPHEDAALVRGVATALNDAARRVEARATLRVAFAEPPKQDLWAVLAACPFDLEIERDNDLGREIEL